MKIGIDLGTTNSLCAYWNGEKPVLIPNALGHELTPSAVSINEKEKVLVGDAARDRLVSHPDRSVSSFKRHIGTQKIYKLGKREFTPVDLSALVLRSLKEDAEHFLKEEVTEAVITVPAYFREPQRNATRAAAEIAGLKVERLVNEPTAASLAYGLHNIDKELKFLVFDLGGGTFDVSVLDMFEQVIEVRASAGDSFLGGDDFTDILVNAFLKEVKPAGMDKYLEPQKFLDPRVKQLLVAAMETAKRDLTNTGAAKISVALEDETYTWDLTAARFKQLAESLLKRLRAPLENALRDARIMPSELDDVLLAGGATRMPIIRELSAQMFGRIPSTSINPEHVVGLGAAVMAGLSSDKKGLKDLVMTDVAPFSLGVETSQNISEHQFEHGVFLPIIERNTTIPASRVQSVSPVSDNQTAIDVRIFQGESRLVSENVYLGMLHVPVPRNKKHLENVDIRFTYDINGLLEVECHVSSTKETKRLVIEDSPGRMTEAEIKKRLKELEALKVHPRDDLKNAAVLARAGKLYEQALGDLREEVGRLLGEFQAVLNRQEPHQIDSAREQLDRILDEIEISMRVL